MQQMMEPAWRKIKHATLKHAQTIRKIERNYQKFKTIIQNIVSSDRPQWEHNVIMAVMAHNKTYHASLKCSPTEISQSRIP